MTKPIFPKPMSKEEYQGHDEELDGICKHCGEITYGGTEPDARAYHCDSCDKKGVYGIEEAMMMGLIEITD